MTPWDDSDIEAKGHVLLLLTPKELEALPDGVVLHSIDGETAVKGVDSLDEDTRFGYTAHGLWVKCYGPSIVEVMRRHKDKESR